MALTRTQRKNLAKLADYLEGLPEDYQHFDMYDYVGAHSDAVTNYARKNGGVAQCGTVACAVGHGPAAGILFRKDEFWTDSDGKPRPMWGAYSARFASDHDDRSPFQWAFGGGWKRHDNHHWGAAARIRYLLKHDEPPTGFNGPASCWLDAYHAFDKRHAQVPA